MKKKKESFKEIHIQTKPVLCPSEDFTIAVELIGHMIRKPHHQAKRKWREFTGRVFRLVGKIPYDDDIGTPTDLREKMQDKNNVIWFHPANFDAYEYALKMSIPVEMPTEEGADTTKGMFGCYVV